MSYRTTKLITTMHNKMQREIVENVEWELSDGPDSRSLQRRPAIKTPFQGLDNLTDFPSALHWADIS